ncbi:uncharacterized protein [Desmodus rotundus]|uniref:uncharacterized protein isoform X1 n=1 Tax=Desmodus rotundus TaxID=9430 RepID=UPI0039E40F71
MGSAALPPSKRGRCIRPLTRASAALRYPTERSELDFREELADGFTCAMNRYKREERQGRDTVQCLSEISHDDIVQELVHESHYSICTFKNLETTAASLEDEGTEVDPPPDLQSNAQPQEGPAEGLMPGPARGPTLALPGLKLYLKPGWSSTAIWTYWQSPCPKGRETGPAE